MENLRKELAKLAGGEFRLDLEKGGPPTGAPVSVEISGPEFEVLEPLARQAKDHIRTVEGVVDLKDDYEPGKPEIRIQVDREQAMLRKVNTASVAQAVRAGINGIKASVLRVGDEEYDITVRFEEVYRDSLEDILDFHVLGKDDVQIPLRDIATVRTAAGLGSINHIDQQRTILISGDVMGRSSSEVMMEVSELLDEKLNMPVGYRLHYSGESAEQDEAGEFLLRAFMVGIMLMLLILVTQFNSVMRPLIILGSVVMSMIGVLLGLIITQNPFGIIMTGMGVISLAGVVVNNAIVLIDYVDQLMEKHGLRLRDALVRAGIVRFRPVMLTAITTVLGLLPMAIGFSIDFRPLSFDLGSQSTELWGPMARPVTFGLLFATVLTLVMVPVMYLVQDKAKQWALQKARALFGGAKAAPTRTRS